MTHRAFFSSRLALLALAAALVGCTPLVESSNGAADNAKRALHDTKEKWKDLLTYHPKSTVAQLPQTRYCYQMQSDIVCYDSLQPHSTAELVGYQDGPNMSWFQPGGGSTGYSGATATSAYPRGNIQPLGGSVADHSEATSETAPAAGVDEITATNNMPTQVKKAPK